MILIMVVSLYTSRIVLKVLGVEDYGIYNVVGGVVVMFGFINSSMSSSTQRFLTFTLGREDFEQLKRVFNLSVTIHLIIAGIIFVLAETIGLWFLNTQLTISSERMNAANWVYQFSIFSFMVNVMSVPYNAVIVSHEKMNIYAYMSILEAALKLIIVILLQEAGFDKLKLYAILVFTVSLIIRVLYQIVCRIRFMECRYSFIWDKELFNDMIGHAGWNLFGSSAVIFSSQGINILLNIFFGPTVNAARGIAFQINGAVSSLVSNFQMAINPQIIKSFALNEIDYMHKLIFRASRFSFYLLLLLVLPIFYQMDNLLALWLNVIPVNTVLFSKLVLLDALILSLAGPLWISGQASGKIKKYQIVVGGIVFLNIPIAYFLLLLTNSPVVPFLSTIIISSISIIARVLMLRRMIQLDFIIYFKSVIINVFIVSVLSFTIGYLLNGCIILAGMQLLTLLLNILLLISVVAVISFYVGLSKNEKNKVCGYFVKFLIK